jgi:hypothetical protein
MILDGKFGHVTDIRSQVGIGDPRNMDGFEMQEVAITMRLDSSISPSELFDGVVPVKLANLAPEKVFINCQNCGAVGALGMTCKYCDTTVA